MISSFIFLSLFPLGLIPYDTDLPMNEHLFLNYYKQVHSLSGIVTSGAKLESTSLVFAYGVDLFFTHTRPSNSFDVLDSSFGYAELLLTSGVLFVAMVLTSWYSKATELKRLWK
jgi:hypothetical protein